MKNKWVAFVLAFLFGMFGVHRFYLGQRKLGFIYAAIFAIGFFHITVINPYFDGPPLFIATAIIGVIDAILFMAMPKSEFNAKYNSGQTTRNRPVGKRSSAQNFRKANKKRYESFRSPNSYKISGIEKYKDYDYEGAIADFKQALKVKYNDAAVHFNLACAYSIMEETDNSFFHLDKAVEFGFDNFEKIQQHDALAYIRTSEQYDAFAANGYRTIAAIEAPKEDLLSTPTPLMDTDILEKIASLGELRDKGFLTEEEFILQKKRLLENP
ncbi:MAG: NINE protein [Bacteroidota bacterium]